MDRRGFIAAAGGFVALPLIGGTLLSMGGCDISGTKPSRPLQLWTLALAPFEAFILEQIAKFEAANPGARVEWTDVPFDAIDRKLLASAAAGRAPDVVNMSDRTFARFVSMGAMVDLLPLVGQEARATFLPGALRIGEIDGKLLAVPWYLTTQTVLANTAMLAAGNITLKTLPRTWAGLLAIAPEFHKATGDYLFSIPLGYESDLPMMFLAEGLVPLREERDGSGKPRLRSDLDRPAIAEYLTKWVDCFRADGLPRESVTEGNAHQSRMYQERRLAVINIGPNFLKRISDVAPGVFAETAVEPPIVGALGRSHISVMVLAVTRQTTNALLAAKLAMHMASAEAQLEICRRGVVLPSVISALDDPMFQMPDPRVLSDQAAEVKRRIHTGQAVTSRALRDGTAFTASLECWPDLRRAFEDGFKKVLLDGRPLAKMLKETSAEWDRIVATSNGDMSAIPRPEPLRGAGAMGTVGAGEANR